ncbi:cation diffusion facilitator family transporter [Pukyongiella litopenaei]|uniref:Cation diffusion facilitator family transporter n=1 Tax=Pukyongiella litopenaei TaxID=2605946 RepID=A0A2S0MM70_9RHOB|nr:cation diffusion facilitator family transporter [Pukyongiella litopenaei]AVO36980.1 cation diffusion facilitator family transporter [Pukyongiella litopenaei]
MREAAVDQAERRRLDRKAGMASVGVAGLLVLAKLSAFAATGSLAIAASAADSAMDLLVSLTALVAILYAARPPDADHAFGHSSAEDLAALGQAVVILASGAAIGVAAVQRLTGGPPPPLRAETLGLAVMGLSVALTLALVLFQRWVARRTDNRIVAADSLHYLGDLIPNIGAIVSLIAARHFGIYVIDTLVAVFAAVLISAGALRIGKRAVDALMDRKAPDAVEAAIARLARDHPGVRDFHDLRTRMAGSRIFVVLHVELDGAQPLLEAHDIGADLRRRILATYPNADVTIHKDVWDPGPRPAP